ncbi:MAG: leucine-rich repeat protein [Clostridia bacterium]|nr:leucine-rich repeat protein [Clostridia bacterium]
MKFRLNKASRLFCLAIVLVLAFQSLFAFTSCKKEDPTSFEYPTRTLAEDAPELEFGLYTYKVYDDNTVILVSYKGSETVISVPDKIDGKPVVELGGELFKEQTQLQTVKIGKNVEVIGALCFVDCTALYDVTIPAKVWSIGTYAFYNTPWLDAKSDEYVIVGDGVLIKYRGTAKVITIPDSVKHIVDAFEYNATLYSVTMGDNVITVGDYSFAFCDNLTHVSFGKNVRRIGYSAFNECSNITKLVLPDKVESIDALAFNYCGALSTLDLGKSIKSIGLDAFYSCVRLKSITVPKTLQTVDNSAFKECNSLMIVFYEGNAEEYGAIDMDVTCPLKDAYIIYDADHLY